MRNLVGFISRRPADGIGMMAAAALMGRLPFGSEEEATVFGSFSVVLAVAGACVLAAWIVTHLLKGRQHG